MSEEEVKNEEVVDSIPALDGIPDLDIPDIDLEDFDIPEEEETAVEDESDVHKCLLGLVLDKEEAELLKLSTIEVIRSV